MQPEDATRQDAVLLRKMQEVYKSPASSNAVSVVGSIVSQAYGVQNGDIGQRTLVQFRQHESTRTSSRFNLSDNRIRLTARAIYKLK